MAARNILVDESLVCKVADFGLSRELETDRSDYTTRGGKIPVRWTAPEAIAYRKFTSSSDVWSFGVVVWEILTYGERPYWNWSNQDVIRAIEDDFRLPPTMNYCPRMLYDLILRCWLYERTQRPKFNEIVIELDNLLRNPTMMSDGITVFKIDIDPNRYIPPIRTHCSVSEWLRILNLERYTDIFLKNGFSGMRQASHLTRDHLESMGITLAAHQRKLLSSLQTIRAQFCHSLPHISTDGAFMV